MKVLGSARGRPLSVDEIMIRAGIDIGQKVQVRGELRAMAREGVCESDGKRFMIPREAPPAPAPAAKADVSPSKRPSVPPPASVRPISAKDRRDDGAFVGTIRRHRDGYGFIASLHGGEDLFVPPQAIGDALDGDLVEARPGPGRDGRPVARTLTVLERRRQFAVGTYRRPLGRSGARVEPRDESLPVVGVSPTEVANDGDVVRVRLDAFEDGVIRGTVVSRLGLPGDPDVEVLSVAYGEGFSDTFPPDVVRVAQSVPTEVRVEDKAGRRDLAGMDLVTIDGEDARDFDDAVYVEDHPRGERLVVAIADVTGYVTANSALDREAKRRATSVYFPQHVLPMLPERLSNGICSLNPKVERLCMVADMVFDAAGVCIETELYPAVMLSKARCTYTQVARILSAESVPALAHVEPMLRRAGVLAKKLTAQRMKRGAIDFDLPESYVRLGESHQVVEIDRRPRNDAHRLVEEFMLAANEAVARFFESREMPTVFRVHGPPKDEKLRVFADLAGAFGYDIQIDKAGRVSPDALNDFLRRVEGRPEQRALNNLLLRSMMQAVYSAENIGHFGLAAPSYLHFTSPIRRYPDLIVHRLLKAFWARGGEPGSKGEREKLAEELAGVAVHCSERERAATSAEREIDAYYAASFMVSRVGERFAGTIASVTDFGLFVELDSPYVQGLIRSETIGSNGRLDQERHRLVFGSRSFGVGDRVQVELSSADPIMRRIDLRLVELGQKVDASGPSRMLSDAVEELKRQRGLAPKRGGGSASKPSRGGGSASKPARGGSGRPKPSGKGSKDRRGR